MTWLLIIVIILLALGAVFVFRYVYPSSDSSGSSNTATPVEALRKSYDTILDEDSPTTGIFISTFDLPTADRLIQTDFDIREMSQCAPIFRKTCGALSYLRADLYPYAFFYPTDDSPTYLGLIFNVAKMWPLIQGMFVVDGATIARDAFSNEVGSPIVLATLSPSSLDPESALTQVILNNAVRIHSPTTIFIDVNEQGVGTSKCASENCRFVNAGGSTNLWMLEFLKADQIDTTGFKLTRVDEPPVGVPRLTDEYYALSFEEDCVACVSRDLCSEGQSIREYVNAGIQDNFAYTLVAQCKYSKEQWKQWFQSQQELYKILKEVVENPKHSNDQFFGKPNNLAYLENEFNMYIYPEAGAEHDTQQAIFLDSVEGIFYINKTCAEQYASVADFPIKGYKTLEARCRDIRNEEQIFESVREKAFELQKAFGRHKHVPVFKANLESNGVVNKDVLATLGSLKFATLFEEQKE